MRTHEAATGREIMSDSVAGGIVGAGMGGLLGYGVTDAGLRGARRSRNSLIRGLARNRHLRMIAAGGAGAVAAAAGGMAGSMMMGGHTWFQGVPKQASAIGTGKLGLGGVGSAGKGVVEALVKAKIAKKGAIDGLGKSASIANPISASAGVLAVRAGKSARAVKPATIAKSVKAMKPMVGKVASEVATIGRTEDHMRFEFVKKASTGTHGGMSGMGVTGSGSTHGMAMGRKRFTVRKKAADGEKEAASASGELEGDDGAFSKAFAAFIGNDISVDREMLTRKEAALDLAMRAGRANAIRSVAMSSSNAAKGNKARTLLTRADRPGKMMSKADTAIVHRQMGAVGRGSA